VIPEPFAGSGGHATIFRIAKHLASFGHEVNIYIVSDKLANRTEEELKEFIERHFFAIGCNVYKWGTPVKESDALVATHWSTAYLVNGLSNARKKFYFVQDFEPYFVPMSAEYLQVENTYRLPLFCITIGQWLTKLLKGRYGADADYFDFGVERDIYYPRSLKKPSRPRIAFYARPLTPRRGFALGIEALRLVYQHNPNVEIVLFGTESLDGYQIPFPYVNKGILSMDELANLYSTAEVGLVLSLSNCSLVPLEMMACKCAVVDLNRETVKGVMTHGVNALLANPEPASIAENILGVLNDRQLRDRIVTNGYEMVQGLSWEHSARQVELILRREVSSISETQETLDHALEPVREKRKEKDQAVELRQEIDRLIEKRNREMEQLKSVLKEAGEYIFKVRRSLPCRIYAKFKGLVKRALNHDQGVIVDGWWRKPVGELVRGRTVGQTFVAREANLYRIDVLLATYARLNTRDVIFHLRDHPSSDQDIATVRVNGLWIRDNEYHSFTFSPLPESKGKSYYFCLESPESVEGDAITIWSYLRSIDQRAVRYENGRPVSAQLIFKAYYLDRRLQEVEMPTYFGLTIVPTPWWKLPWKAWLVSKRRGIRAVWEEARSYLGWRRSQR